MDKPSIEDIIEVIKEDRRKLRTMALKPQHELDYMLAVAIKKLFDSKLK